MRNDDFFKNMKTGTVMPHVQRLAHLDRVGELLQAEQYESIVVHLDSVIRKDSRQPHWYALRAQAHSELGRHKLAIKDIATALSLAPSAPHAHLLSALIRHAAGDREGALKALKDALRFAPDDPEMFAKVGAVQIDFGEIKEAVETYSAYIRAHPDDGVDFIRYRAALRAVLGDTERALRELDGLIEKDPQDSHTYHIRGTVLEREGKLLPALSDYRRAARLSPGCHKEKFASDATRLHQVLESIV